MSTQPGPWSHPPGDPGGPGPEWTQPGPGSAPPAPVYGPVPTHSSGPTNVQAPAPPPAYGPIPGYPLPPDQPGPPGPLGHPPAVGPGPVYPPAYAVPLRTDYAGWGKRVGAMLIDNIPSYVGLVVFYVGYAIWLVQISTSASAGVLDFGGGALPMLIGLVIMLAGFGWTIYNRWLVAGRTGQSLGKRVTRIRLVSELTDAPIGPMNAFLRDLVHILDGMAYVGYLWPLWDDKRQTFADKIVRTVVVTA